jgi:hypothetical protein
MNFALTQHRFNMRRRPFWRKPIIQGLVLNLIIPSQLALGVAAYTPPCHELEDSFNDAKETLSDCVNHLRPASSKSSPIPSDDCSAELKKLNDKSNLLRDCKVDPSKSQYLDK